MTTAKRIYGFPVLLLAACSVVGVLAAAGKFNSMIGFPLVFAGICVVLGLISLWRDPGRRAPRVALVLVGAAIAIGGWFYQMGAIRESMAATQREVIAALGGEAAPRLAALEPLATEPAALAAAASYRGKATIVSFWATWCSPCWTEMAELQELYEEHRASGLTVRLVRSMPLRNAGTTRRRHAT